MRHCMHMMEYFECIVLQFILRHAIFFLSQIRFGCTYVIHKYP